MGLCFMSRFKSCDEQGKASLGTFLYVPHGCWFGGVHPLVDPFNPSSRHFHHLMHLTRSISFMRLVALHIEFPFSRVQLLFSCGAKVGLVLLTLLCIPRYFHVGNTSIAFDTIDIGW